MSRRHITIPVPAALGFLQSFVDAGVLQTIDIAFAEFVDLHLVTSVKGKDRRAVLLAAALTSRAPQQGHVAVDLATIAETAAVDSPTPRLQEGEDPPPEVGDLDWPDGAHWVATFQRHLKKGRFEGLVHHGEERLDIGQAMEPLVFRNDLLYLQRYFHYEATVAAALRKMLPDFALRAVPSTVAQTEMLDGAGLEASQRQAAEHAIGHRLTILSGGPGTGKTFTLTRILAALLVDNPALRIGLAAPTGKAAGRMKEAIKKASADEQTVGALLAETEAVTVHRLLGRGDGIRFRHGVGNPLPLDLVVVDEVSMVSLPLMGRLIDAIGPETKLILVGDPHQLASVEAGAVLADITSSTGPIRDAIVTLTIARRFESGSGIEGLADAIRAGDADRAITILTDPLFADVELLGPAESGSLLDQIIASGQQSLGAAAEGRPADAAAFSSGIKVLCATRRGWNGRDAWQKRIEGAVLADMGETAFRGRWYVGRPVIVVANDYLLNLFNGDTGVVVQDGRQRAVVFPGSSNVKPLAPAQLGAVETWWAMTIHKSQGSEFPHAVVALPEPGSPILTRELLYTGVTRAQKKVTIIATEEAVRTAIQNPIRRATGLAGLLAS